MTKCDLVCCLMLSCSHSHLEIMTHSDLMLQGMLSSDLPPTTVATIKSVCMLCCAAWNVGSAGRGRPRRRRRRSGLSLRDPQYCLACCQHRQSDCAIGLQCSKRGSFQLAIWRVPIAQTASRLCSVARAALSCKHTAPCHGFCIAILLGMSLLSVSHSMEPCPFLM